MADRMYTCSMYRIRVTEKILCGCDILVLLFEYRKVWLISACTYHSQWYGNMRLLDDVHLIESEILAPPTASMFARSITKLASYEHSDS